MTSQAQNSLMMAILSLDAYNRGYYAGLDMTSHGTSLGNAAIWKSSTDFMGNSDKDAGFYAISYTYNGETVISYRGTDNQSVLYDPTSGAGDVNNGWTIGGAIICQQ